MPAPSSIRPPAPAPRDRLPTAPITRKLLLTWAGEHVMRDADTLYRKGLVEQAEYAHPHLRGAIRWGNRTLQTELEVLANGHAENHCPCRDSTERGIICSHIIAVGLAIVERQADPEREARYQAERRQAERLARFDEHAYIRRATPQTPGAVPTRIHLVLDPDWPAQLATGAVRMRCEAETPQGRVGLGELPRGAPYAFGEDDSLLFVLEDVSEGPCRTELETREADFINILRLRRGRTLDVADGASVTVNDIAVQSTLFMDLDRENGELLIFLRTELPFLPPGAEPLYLVGGRKNGWAYGAGHFWPLAQLLPEPLRGIYREPVIVPRPAVPGFLRREAAFLQQQMTVVTDIAPDLFTIEPATPAFRLEVRGSPASLAATLYAEYEGVHLVAAKSAAAGDFAIPDPADLMRYLVRNPTAEARALERLADMGLRGTVGDELAHIVGVREVLNFLGRDLPRLRRMGWKVNVEGKVAPLLETVDYVTPVVHVRGGSGVDWFDIDFQYDTAGPQSLTEGEIQRAMLMGDAYVEKSGRTYLIDVAAIEAMRDVFQDLAGRGEGDGRLRVDGIHAGYVKASLDALDGVDVESPREWRALAGRQNREIRTEESVPLPAPIAAVVRPYQRDGVQWLRFLELNGFGGILADEMGLGKTLQTLAWLAMERSGAEARGKPALVVCPTSLVDNWAEEAARFAPALRVLVISGADRHRLWDRLPEAHLVVTSYALLRRDIDRHRAIEYAAVVLDEAQHIKNRATQNAQAAKQLRTRHRLVLSGTPVENGVSDIWSIMDFLMPRYLGSHDAFRANYEMPIERGGMEGDYAQSKLRRKLTPFLLRRLKTQVARDLPPRIEKLQSCALTADQQLVYKQYLEASRRRIADMVATRGFQQSRMEIFKVLLRLRQVCCHLDLLKLPGLKSEYPSAKLDLFCELVSEAVDGGHRILVFSQFTSMLAILRRETEQRGWTSCYLDGGTRDRMAVVREFNTRRDIPLFLISLKAGGTGLNLTGADMVIHFDPWWNPAVEDQATDRAHRIGQQRTVYSLKLITRDTVEEKVLALQLKKRAIINATVEQPGAADMTRLLTWDDVQELLAL